MKPSIKPVLLWGLIEAIPIELANFYLAMPPLDVGLAPNAPWYASLMAFEWVILHWPGLRLSNWIEQMGFQGFEFVILFASGYIDTVLLIVASIFGFRFICDLAGKGPRNLSRQSEG
jgi:hypothetical protein